MVAVAFAIGVGIGVLALTTPSRVSADELRDRSAAALVAASGMHCSEKEMLMFAVPSDLEELVRERTGWVVADRIFVGDAAGLAAASRSTLLGEAGGVAIVAFERAGEFFQREFYSRDGAYVMSYTRRAIPCVAGSG
ncbi:MAG: hypothetical protein HYX57_12170 [Chloroflexi bacterium]|nr:hypothetical protein [Chloroflexota bacterium]